MSINYKHNKRAADYFGCSFILFSFVLSLRIFIESGKRKEETNMSMVLNEKQQEAATTLNGCLLIVAVAGSGKRQFLLIGR